MYVSIVYEEPKNVFAKKKEWASFVSRMKYEYKYSSFFHINCVIIIYKKNDYILI